MTADPVRRGAARLATLVAVPVAVAVAGISLWTYGGFGAPTPAPSTPAPSAATPASTTPVTMAAPPLAEDVATICRAAVAKLPDSIQGLPRRAITAGAEQNAAYGDPALTFACGVVQPSFPPSADVYPLADVCWVAQPGQDGTVWFTVDRTVAVAVTVPGPQSGSAQSVVPLARVVATTVPRTATPPPGCA
jgi:hypothetical protein